jgi:hypothetical protein
VIDYLVDGEAAADDTPSTIRERIQERIKQQEEKLYKLYERKAQMLSGQPDSYERVVFDMLKRKHTFAAGLVELNHEIAFVNGFIVGSRAARSAWQHQANVSAPRQRMRDRNSALQAELDVVRARNAQLELKLHRATTGASVALQGGGYA